jgi:nucleotide-binding universal stress UspA family protein
LTVELGPGDEVLPSLPEVALKRILVATDFSAPSRKAVRYAASFAKQFGAEILLLHVVEPIPPPPPAVGLILPESLDVDMREEAATHLAKWRERLSGIRVKANVRVGAPYHEIITAAEETNTDLIIIATHGHSRLAQMFIGSTAERVVRHATCPVLVVREHEHDFVSPARAKTKARRSKGE